MRASMCGRLCRPNRPGEGVTYRLPASAPAGETWRYPPGSLVRCTIGPLDGHPVLIAVEAIG
jgi:hypothetical protein